MIAMGVLRQAIARGVLHFVAMLVSMVSGIVLARRLDSSSYALYQMIARCVTSQLFRVSLLVSGRIGIVLWVLRVLQRHI